jgi:hypothetical protein
MFLFELTVPDKRLFPFWNILLKPIRIFTKTLTMHDIVEYTKSENVKFLVIEASHGNYYGFNIRVKKEREIAMKIVSPDEQDNFMIVGWKASKKLPKWVGNADSWIDFINLKEGTGDNEEEEEEEGEDVEEEKQEEEDEDDEDGEEEDKEEEEDEEEKEDEEKEVKDEGEEKEGEEGDEEEDEDDLGLGGEHDKDDDKDNELDAVLIANADPLPYRGGKKWQGDPVVEKGKSFKMKKEHKKANEEKVNTTSSYGSFANFENGGSIFASINGDDLKKEVAKNVKLAMKSNTIDIFITGPFCNAKTGKSTWAVVFGDYGSAWTLKSQFLKGYIATLLTKFKLSNINASHAGSYYDINICKYEYGNESSWRRKDGSKTIKRLSFAYTCDTTNKKSGKQGLMDAVQFFFLCMKKRDENPIGSLLVDHLKEHSASLYDYLLKKKPNEEQVAEDITDNIDKHYRAGFVLHWDDCLNHWMVDYDIIRVLKGYVGYSSWTDVPAKQRGLCFKNYNQSMTLPDWDIEQERYYRFVSRDPANGVWIHTKPINKPIYRSIPFRNSVSILDYFLDWANTSKYSILEYFVFFSSVECVS